MRSTLKPLHLGSLRSEDFTELMLLPNEAASLEWLWRKRASADGDHAWCSTCNRLRRFHRARTRPAYTCDSCGTHVHPTADSIFQGSSTPLTTWFAAIDAVRLSPTHPPTAKSLELSLGVPYATSRRIRQRIIADLQTSGPERSSDSETIRARLLEAASRCIAERGYDGAKVKDIADRAEVSPATVLYHFDSRAKVLMAALEWATRRASERRQTMLAAQPDPASRLAGLIAMSIPTSEIVRTELLVWNEYFARTARGELPGADDALASRYRDSFEHVINEGLSSGTFSADAEHSEDLIEELLALVDGLAIATLVGRVWMPSDRATRILSRFVHRELGVDIAPLVTEHLLNTPRR